jgi:hypothetical protein
LPAAAGEDPVLAVASTLAAAAIEPSEPNLRQSVADARATIGKDEKVG